MQFKRALQHTIAWKSLNTVLAFFINLLLVRILGAAASGDFFYSLTILAFFTLASSWSLEAGITYYGSNDHKNIPAITLFLFPWMLVQGVCLWGLLQSIGTNLDHQLSWIFIVANLAIIYFSALFYARKWVFTVNIVACVVNVLVLGILVIIYFRPLRIPGVVTVGLINGNGSLPGENFNLAELSYFGGFLLQALVLIIIFFSRSGLQLTGASFKPAMVQKLFVYSSIAFISNLLFFLVTRIDYYFVKLFCDEIALSNYVQVSKIGQVLILVPSMMATVIFPYSSGEDKENYLDKLQLLCRGITFVFIPVAALVAISGYWLFPWLFGEAFQQMFLATLWYLPGFYCLSITSLLAAYLAGKSMLNANLVASLVALMVVIACDLLVIPNWGINGAAAASSLAYFICLCLLLWVYKTKLNIEPLSFVRITRGDLRRLNRLK